jgi:hypothetical protein
MEHGAWSIEHGLLRKFDPFMEFDAFGNSTYDEVFCGFESAAHLSHLSMSKS